MKRVIRYACALLGGIAATGAMAQSSVTVYGVLDAAIQAGRTAGQSTTRVDSSAVAPSRFGFQGAEDLGEGVQAIFKLEGGINGDTGTSANGGALFGREAWAGLRGSWGQAQIGLNYTPLYLSYVTYAQGELNSLGWGNATNNFIYVPAARAANSIRYASPALAGLTVRGLYSFGNENAAGQPKRLGNTAAIGVNYKDGNFSADVDYLRQTYAATATLPPATAVDTGTYFLVGASYDFGAVKPAFLYQIHRHSANAPSAIAATYANPDSHFYEVNALVRAVANGTVLLSYGEYKKQSSDTGNSKSYGVRYDYSLSRRTGWYIGGSRIQNAAAANFTISSAGGPGIATAAGASINGVIVGVITKF